MLDTEESLQPLHQRWRQLLDKHSLAVPDGRSLYAYRLTEEDFETLQTSLRSKLDGYLKSGTLSALVNSNAIFCALFVLYAAEWWRRRYDGSKWSWEPILADLGASQDSWSSIQRNDCVARGLNKWQLKISETAGYRYLGAVAVQGGLPMQLLAIAKGNIGRILRRVLGLARGGAAGFTEIRDWIASLKNELPKSYQKEEIYVLLTEVVTTVLNLGKDAGLTKSADAVILLDQTIPDWRDRFPFPVGDVEIQGLIEQLIRDVADDKERKRVALQVERSLELQHDEIWQLCSSIALPEVLSTQDISAFFPVTGSGSIPRIIEFVIEASDHHLSINARRLAGHDRYRLERRPCEFSGQVAMGEHRLTLRATDGRHQIAPLCNGEPLDQELPWIFAQSQQNSPRLVRQGGGSVQAVEALVAIPSGWNVATGFSSSCFLKAFIEAPDREVYEIKGDATISDTQGHRWTIKTGQANATEESYQWSGDRVWEEFLRPNLAFRGRPILRREIHGEAGESRISEHLLNWQPPNVSAGPVEVTYAERQELRHRSRMVLLPKGARVSFEPKSLNCGTIHLRHWHAVNACLTETAGVDLRLNRDGDSLALICSSPDATPPEWIEIEVIWEGNTTPARIRLPFPFEGARAFDASGAELPKDAWLSAQRLTGVRLVTMFHSPVPVELRFRLRHTKEQNNAHEASHQMRTANGSSRIDIRLQDYAEDIDRLLAADELLDAWVEVSLSLNHKEALRIRVSRYACPLERVASDVQLTAQGMRLIASEILNTLPVLALRLEQPGEEAITLPAKLSEGVPTGAWEFVSNKREPGSWLIYPGPDSALPFRPTLWMIPGETPATTSLTHALSIEGRQRRAEELDRVIGNMSADFLDPCWVDLERLGGHLGHLPLSTLDLWRRFVHSPSGMAALALRLSHLPSGFLRRFPLEQPFVWELVSINEWIEAADQLKKQCVAWFGEATSPKRFGEFLSERVAELTTHQPALSNLLGIVKSGVLNDGCKEITMMRATGSDNHFSTRLFSGEQSALQMLLRGHADETWPSDSRLYAWVNDIRRQGAFAHLFPKESLTFRDGVLGLPVLLAIQVATNATGEWLSHAERIHTLRTYQAFDPDWFTEAFDLTIARCLSTGIMKI